MAVIVFGSTNVDIALPVVELPRPGETVLTASYRAVPGGKGCNQAVAAAKLGKAFDVPVQMVGAVGQDAWASIPLDAMTAVGIDVRDVMRLPQPTALAAVMVATSGENSIVVASGANFHVRAEQLARMTHGDVLVCQMEVLAEETAAALLKAKADGATTVLNLAPYGKLPVEARGAVDYWVVNELEGNALATELGLRGGIAEIEPVAAARALAEPLAANVVLTLGSHGAVAATSVGETWRVPTLTVDAVDTTGAGDAFVGGLAVALADEQSVPDALRSASAAGGLACTGFGAQEGLQDANQALEAMALLTVVAVANS